MTTEEAKKLKVGDYIQNKFGLNISREYYAFDDNKVHEIIGVRETPTSPVLLQIKGSGSLLLSKFDNVERVATLKEHTQKRNELYCARNKKGFNRTIATTISAGKTADGWTPARMIIMLEYAPLDAYTEKITEKYEAFTKFEQKLMNLKISTKWGNSTVWTIVGASLDFAVTKEIIIRTPMNYCMHVTVEELVEQYVFADTRLPVGILKTNRRKEND